MTTNGNGTMVVARYDVDDEGAGYAIVTEAAPTTDRLEVEIWLGRSYGSKVLEAKVNWSAMGSKSPAIARRYAALIARAAEIADRLIAASTGAGTNPVALEMAYIADEHSNRLR